MGKKKSGFRKGFRKNKRIQHPTYLVDQDGRLYRYIGITHSPRTGDRDNIPLYQNPNPKDTRKAYLRPEVEKDEPKNFGRRLEGWKFGARDEETVRRIVNRKKKPRK